MELYKKEFIELVLSCGALKFGQFTLKSGRKSPYFFNMGHLYQGKSLEMLGYCYAKIINDLNTPTDIIYGPAYKGISIAVAASISSRVNFKREISYSFHRKEEKTYGEKGLLVGSPLSENVVIVDDVITKGTAIREAIANIKDYSDATITAIIIALDRKEKGSNNASSVQEVKDKYGINVYSILTIDDILSFSRSNLPSDISEKISAYQLEFCVC